jgi:HNH endonuclease/AP2 domain
MLTAAKLREVLSYDPLTGEFLWLIKSNTRDIGSIAGSFDSKGYRQIKIDQRVYKAHRLAWLYIHGVWPMKRLDHFDGVKNNNCLSNLREATPTQNLFNTGLCSSNQTGFKGVSFHKRSGKFIAAARIHGKKTHLGLYATAELASEAYQATAKEHHGTFHKGIP